MQLKDNNQPYDPAQDKKDYGDDDDGDDDDMEEILTGETDEPPQTMTGKDLEVAMELVVSLWFPRVGIYVANVLMP